MTHHSLTDTCEQRGDISIADGFDAIPRGASVNSGVDPVVA